jgi:GNAT superfamily N-acetyltransferase
MPDMLVKLYAIPELQPVLEQQQSNGVDIRRALLPEKHVVVDWVRQRWGDAWASECEASFYRQPASCFIAVVDEQLVGFACHEVTHRNFFGPFGVDSMHRGSGIGTALLLATLHDMRASGYAYAIIGSAGPGALFARAVGAVAIDDSTPGIYRGMLRGR